MNGYQRIASALRGEWPDTVPVMLHNFLHAAREAGYSQRQYREDPGVIAEVSIRAIERYGYDGVLLDVDTATLAGAVGVPVDFPEDHPARCAGAALATLDAVADLPPPEIARDDRVGVWLEAARRLKAHFGDEIYLRGNCDQAPFSLASMMRSPAEWMMDLLDPEKEEAVRRLLDYCTDATKQFVSLMAATGVHAVSNGDSSAGPDMISPKLYRTHAQPFEKQVVDRAAGLGVPYVLHICGNTDAILDDMIATGATGLELDYKTDMHRARLAMDGRCTFLGNLDPSGVIALGTTERVIEETRWLLEVFASTPRFILNAGCAIPEIAPAENIRAMIAVARAVGRL